MFDDTRVRRVSVGNMGKPVDNRKLETRGGMLAISRSRNSKIGGKWNAARNGARMMKPGRHPLPCVYKPTWPAPRALASIFAPPNFAFLECKFYRNERIARNEGGCSDDSSVLARPLREKKSKPLPFLSRVENSSYFPFYLMI